MLIPLRSPQEAVKPTAVAVGSFDGLHKGHRRVITNISENSTTIGVPTVVSFWPHPREVLYGDPRLRLDMPAEKLTLLESLGIKQLVLVPFSERLAELTPEIFVRQVLKQQLGALKVAVGKNFRFGVNRSGDTSALGRIAQEMGIKVEILPILWDGNERVSSSRIRRALGEGKIQEATRLLGRPYRFSGRVVNSSDVKRNHGLPTLKVIVDGRKFLPRQGIYAVWVRLDKGDVGLSSGGPIGAIMSLGPQSLVDPTIPSQVEVYFLDGRADFDEVRVYIEPVSLLRGQQEFWGTEGFYQQIHNDIMQARKRLEIPNDYNIYD
uniref:Bifunctional riboflavin kinase/FMN adenylyltransferase n=1 Tax=Paulinella chromatophora TaxID=39717 RepID=B1X3R7_PAUCH|nr:putative riboflavin kinase/FAD synthase [Paulinella chromatophora]ACB42586.1 putative riboflavin kinase/FAD synthase [Paulinella chromatophora]